MIYISSQISEHCTSWQVQATGQYCEEIHLLIISLLRQLSSWFLIILSKRHSQVGHL